LKNQGNILKQQVVKNNVLISGFCISEETEAKEVLLKINEIIKIPQTSTTRAPKTLPYCRKTTRSCGSFVETLTIL
jgi:predicted transcriptional regulator